jgi:predicted ATP-grasp superfamily ATP-dependent carboligase
MKPTQADTRAALVTDGLWRKSLSTVRALGKDGFQVTVMGESVFTTGFWSRYTHRRVKAPTAETDAEAFGSALLQELRRAPGTVLFPMEDATLAWVASNLDKVNEHGRLLLPPADSIRIAQDKAATIAVAQKLGLPVPQTWEPRTAEEFAERARQLAEGTFVVKPRSARGSHGIVYQSQPDRNFWLEHWKRHGPMLIQERIPADGRALGVSLLLDQRGECVAVFAHERLQQYPVSGGPSTDRQSIHAPELVEWSLALLRRLDWRGLAMVEWKVDPRDGKPKLMEINPRLWGSLELAIRAGVNFPVLYARAALGEALGPPPSYPDGVRCRWFMPGEILRYKSQPKSQREPLREFLCGLPQSAEEWDTQDIRGCIATVVCTAALALNPRYWKFVQRP